jgi:two-component system response regulator (stage 0 sporulation protein A)
MKIIIADTDQDFCELLEYSIRAVMPSVQLEAVYDGVTLLQRVEERQPELVILNLMLPHKDGLAAFAAIRAMDLPVQPQVMVLSGYLTPRMQEELCHLRPCFFTALPCDLQALTQRVQSCCRELVFTPFRRREDADTERCRLLRELGLTMHCKGFSYIRYGLQLLAEKPNLGLGVTKWLYPAIAAHYQTTAVNVERAIRSAVIVAWQRKGYLLQHRLFRERPTNSELFAVAEEYLRQEQRMTGTR